ncbi:hypothetical protein [Deinococcus gobiensis]|uniref:Uncharacterized protein n=1 Tax=Deinococcus gobiensis (strain DSM 21396 / JCM 16679 / CGMCC 1.7299 / I-0) TaxID=745776 RepID=H8H1K6_DEIGI|nr:hypothetical protein [Deinococcus gobiensis]AFD27403.1 hypothetical protein DGo_PB0134 [Deinococcus gobiensis I-0]
MPASPHLPDRTAVAQALQAPEPFPLHLLQHHLADDTATLPDIHPATLATTLDQPHHRSTGETTLLLSAGHTLRQTITLLPSAPLPPLAISQSDTLHLCYVQDGRLDTYTRLALPHACVQLTHGLTAPQLDDPVVSFPGTLDDLRLLIRYLQQLEARLLTEPHSRLLDPQVFADLLVAHYGGQRLPHMSAPAQLRLHDTWERPWTHDALPGGTIRTLTQALGARGWTARSQGLAQRLLASLPPTPFSPTSLLTLAQDTPEAWAGQLDWDQRLWHLHRLYDQTKQPEVSVFFEPHDINTVHPSRSESPQVHAP